MERTAQLSSDTTRLRQERENLLRVNDALSAELKLRPKQLPSVTEDLECQTEADGLLERALAAERESQSLKDANQKTESMLKDSQESVARLSTDLKAQEESALTEREILQRRLQELLNELHIRENEVHTLRDEVCNERFTGGTQSLTSDGVDCSNSCDI